MRISQAQVMHYKMYSSLLYCMCTMQSLHKKTHRALNKHSYWLIWAAPLWFYWIYVLFIQNAKCIFTIMHMVWSLLCFFSGKVQNHFDFFFNFQLYDFSSSVFNFLSMSNNWVIWLIKYDFLYVLGIRCLKSPATQMIMISFPSMRLYGSMISYLSYSYNSDW